jgi:hypothetical protein
MHPPLLLLLIRKRRVVVLAGGLESLVRQFLARVLLFCAHKPKPSFKFKLSVSKS